MSRFNSFVNIINAGGYKLAEMKERIHGLADRGELTLDERDKLLGMAETHADPLAETEKGNMLADHERRIKALENKIAELMKQSGETEDGELNVADIAEYVPGKWYYAGDVVMWNGEAYACIAPDGVVCVWSPTDYPDYWQKVE